jgi:hypothetical protein
VKPCPLAFLFGFYSILARFLADFALCRPYHAGSAAAWLEQLGMATLTPESLPEVLAEGAATLQSKIKSLAARLADSRQQLSQTQTPGEGKIVGTACEPPRQCLYFCVVALWRLGVS